MKSVQQRAVSGLLAGSPNAYSRPPPMGTVNNPGADKAGVEKLRPLGEPSVHLDSSQRAIWFELQSQTASFTLTSADRFTVEMLCVLMAQFRTDPAKMSDSRISRMHAILKSLAMTPLDRQKLFVAPPPESNVFDSLDEEPGEPSPN
ncbi:MAG: hypothetical protein ACT4PZ_15075 [Panacagrimonas sp.]